MEHKARYCWAPGSTKEEQHPKGKQGQLNDKDSRKAKANTATADTVEPDGVWIADAGKNPNNWLTEIRQKSVLTIDNGGMVYTNIYDHFYLAGENLES